MVLPTYIPIWLYDYKLYNYMAIQLYIYVPIQLNVYIYMDMTLKFHMSTSTPTSIFIHAYFSTSISIYSHAYMWRCQRQVQSAYVYVHTHVDACVCAYEFVGILRFSPPTSVSPLLRCPPPAPAGHTRPLSLHFRPSHTPALSFFFKISTSDMQETLLCSTLSTFFPLLQSHGVATGYYSWKNKMYQNPVSCMLHFR